MTVDFKSLYDAVSSADNQSKIIEVTGELWTGKKDFNTSFEIKNIRIGYDAGSKEVYLCGIDLEFSEIDFDRVASFKIKEVGE